MNNYQLTLMDASILIMALFSFKVGLNDILLFKLYPKSLGLIFIISFISIMIMHNGVRININF